jgi:hypothetical protein
MTLAFQWYFSRQDHSPVPSFIVYDQPSQVYFPKRVVNADQDPDWRDEDVEAVKQLFSMLATYVSRAGDKIQIIVVDHAANDIWGQFPNVHAVEEWRGNTKLVPLEWLA